MMNEDRITNFDLDAEAYQKMGLSPISRGHFDPDYQAILREGQQTRKPEHLQKEEAETILRMEALNRLVQTEDGIIFFRWLCKTLGFKGLSLVKNPMTNEVNMNGLLYNEARRIVWNEIRNQLSIANRNRIEEEI